MLIMNMDRRPHKPAPNTWSQPIDGTWYSRHSLHYRDYKLIIRSFLHSIIQCSTPWFNSRPGPIVSAFAFSISIFRDPLNHIYDVVC